jgi:hypothetical protein
MALRLPLGIWTAAALACWLRDDGRIRCDDYLVKQDSSIRIAISANTALERCAPGDVLIIGRYPRGWQSPSGNDVVFTTQPGVLRFSTGRPVLEELPGSVCLASLMRDVPSAPTGKAQGWPSSTA